jgi:hypothetical protein
LGGTGVLTDQSYECCVMLTDQKGNPVLDQFSENGFVDLTLRILKRRCTKTLERFHLSASFADEIVGFDVAMVLGMRSGFDKDMNLVRKHVYRPGVWFRRSGPESDRLIAAVAKLYKKRRAPKPMVEEESFTAIALHQGQLNWDRDPVKLKLFGRDSEPFIEKDYYESYFNVDFANGLVFWNEKDQDYRGPLLGGLSSSTRRKPQ